MNSSVAFFALASFASAALNGASKDSSPSVTFNKQIAPIFYQRCVECHRSGEVAPMSLLTYKEARPWAKAIKEKVTTRVMPPWLADPKYGHFINDRHMSDTQIETVVAWVNARGPEVDPRA